MLDVFRKASRTWVVKVLFMMLALSFVAWGVGDVIRGGRGRGPAIEVGRTGVTAAEVQSEFKREVDRLQPLYGGKLSSEEARKMGVMDRVVQSVITRTLIDESARALKLASVDEPILRKVAANPAFRGLNGQFDREAFRARLSRAGLTEEGFLRTERANQIRTQMVEALSGTVRPPSAMATPLIGWREERRIAETALIADATLPLPAAPDAATLDAFYHDNQARFMAPEYRALSVLLLRPADLAASIDIDEVMVHDAYRQRIEDFTTPERRQIAQIIVDGSADVSRAYELLGHGKDLAAIAKALGKDILDLGQVEKRDLPEGLAEAVFKLKAGETGQPVKTALGWHIVRVGAIQPGRVAAFADVRGQIEKDLRREKALDSLSDVATKLEDALGGGATLEEAASRFSLKLLKLPAVDAQGRDANGRPIADLPHSDQFLDVAFHTDASIESPLTEVPNDGYFLLRVDGVTPPAPRPLASIRAEAIGLWQAERRHEAALDKARHLAERTKAGDSFAAIAAGAGLKVETSKPLTRDPAQGGGMPASLVRDLFAADPNEVIVAPQPGGVALARIVRIVPFDPAASPAVNDADRRRVAQALANDIAEQYVAALNASIGVKLDKSQLSSEE